MKTIDEFFVALSESLDDKKSYISKNGAIRIGRLEKTGSHAYLHVIFPAVSRQVIDAQMHRNEISIPKNFLEYMDSMNGCILFQGALSIYGYRGELSRDPDLVKPFDLFEANTLMRPFSSDPQDFFIGSYDEDGSFLYVRPDSLSVYRRSRKDPKVLASWPNINDFLSAEVSRIQKLFDRNGEMYDASVPTV